MYARQIYMRRRVDKQASRFARRSRLLRFLPGVLIGLVLASLALVGTNRPVFATSVVGAPIVDMVSLNSEIDASSQRFLTGAISTAEADGSQALVVQINTPGGDIDAMQAIIAAEMSSTVPIISYVSPAGGFAASAGAFVALAAPIAAMAPSTTIGASSPVNGDGSDLDSTMKAKVESVLVTDMTNIQQRYGRQVAPAVKMVTNASSYGPAQAKALGIIDLQANNSSDLLTQVNGRVVTLASGQSITLQTAGASLQNLNPSLLDNLYALLVDPNVIFLLFLLALIGLYIEISHPGMILPGVVGAIALVLFLFGAGTLSPDWAGLALMALAGVLLILDVRLLTHGVLTVGAVISLVIGALLFFNSGGPYQGASVNPFLIYGAGAVVGCLSLYIVAVVVRSKRNPVTTGTEGMLGSRVIALTPLLPEGRVSYGGEDWLAVLDPPTMTVDTGSELRIASVEGLRLHVQLATSALPSVKTKNVGNI